MNMYTPNRSLLAAALLGLSTAVIPEASAQDLTPKARISIKCVSADVVAPGEAVAVQGSVDSFVWMHKGKTVKNVARTGKLPLVCDSDESTLDAAGRDAISVKIPARATQLRYKVTVSEAMTEGVSPAPRTVCKGEVNFNRSLGDLAVTADVVDLGDLPRHAMDCALGGGNKAVFKIAPFTRELPAG